ncbi:MAG: site-specific DNA-methyltransferase, partial [Sphaerospermopsis sp.]|nr:site-specific DNA-methyltransferase [Sphaerospermopsis sp.]
MKRQDVEKVEITSGNINAEQIKQLKAIFPEVFTEGEIDFAKLQATLGKIIDDRPERYSFTWAGKREAIQVLQASSRGTLKPERSESVDFDYTQNLFIEGDNLEVLKLLRKSYAGQVKMIYIDPPYNTGNDFIYPDNYTDPLDNYLELTGQKDSEGNLQTSNPETSGRYHSAWLSMMYP